MLFYVECVLKMWYYECVNKKIQYKQDKIKLGGINYDE